MEYLIRFAQTHESFRRPEIEALASLQGIDIEFLFYDRYVCSFFSCFHVGMDKVVSVLFFLFFWLILDLPLLQIFSPRVKFKHEHTLVYLTNAYSHPMLL